MDIQALKNRLAALQNPKSGQGKDYKKDIWKPAVGKHLVRLVPSKFDKSNPFKELFFHYDINKKTMISPKSFGQKDPIIEFAQQLRKSSNKEDWQLAKKLEPKLRVFAPVIVRNEEDKGVRLWEFGKQIYMDLLAIAEDEDVGDFSDVISGRDLMVETQSKETTGLTYNTSTVRIKTKITPLSDDSAKVKLWLQEQPNPGELFKNYKYEEMKAHLMAHLNPEDDTTEPEVTSKEESTGDLPWETEAPAKSEFTLSTPKSDIDKKLDDLFDF